MSDFPCGKDIPTGQRSVGKDEADSVVSFAVTVSSLEKGLVRKDRVYGFIFHISYYGFINICPTMQKVTWELNITASNFSLSKHISHNAKGCMRIESYGVRFPPHQIYFPLGKCVLGKDRAFGVKSLSQYNYSHRISVLVGETKKTPLSSHLHRM